MMYLVAFNFTDILLLLFGVFVGLIWGTFIFVKRKRKLIMKRINKGFTNIDAEKQKIINEVINKVYQYHVSARKTKFKMLFGLVTIKKKVNYEKLALDSLGVENSKELIPLVKEILILINNIAEVYYPNSENPIYELSIDQIFSLLREIENLLRGVLSDLGIPHIEELRISQLKEIIIIGGKVKDVYNIKGVRFSINCLNAAIKIQSVLTPIYWIKKGTKSLSVSSLSQFLVKCLFEIIGKETANIYSENFSNK